MKTRIIHPPEGGTIKAMPSKSVAHRLLICAHMSGIDIKGVCDDLSEDLAATTDCLLALKEGALEYDGKIPVLNCRESGSTLRFLLPLSAVLFPEVRMIGSGRLMKRPLRELEQQLTAHGCRIERKGEELTIFGKLHGGNFDLPGDVSSQYVSGLLFALPLLDEESEIRVRGHLQSRPYVDLTLDALAKSKISITEDGSEGELIFRIPGGQTYDLDFFVREDIEGDWSNGAFWLAAEALGAQVMCTGLDSGSLQGDRIIEEIIADCRKAGELRIDVGQCPDLVPVIALLAMARSRGAVTRIVNAGRLRMKESDRIESVVTTVLRLGGSAKATEDEIEMIGMGDRKCIPVGVIDSFNDHRIVMMAAIGALICEGPVEIEGSQAVRKSYPGFFDDYVRLGGEVMSI